MASGYDRAFSSGKHKAHGLNVQVIADPIGRLVWISPPLPGARHDMGAAREHGIIDAIAAHEILAVADTAYQGAGPTVAVPQRRRRIDPDTGRYPKLSAFQKDVNTAHARQRGPGVATPTADRGLRLTGPDDSRRCRACTRPGLGTPIQPWPCGLYKLAMAAKRRGPLYPNR